MEIYGRREWSAMTLAGILTGIGVAYFFVCAERGDRLAAEDASWFLPVMLGIAVFVMTVRGSARIAVTADELKVCVGYGPFMRRTLPLDGILSIERTRVPWYRAQPSKGWGIRRECYAVSPGAAFLVRSGEGKPCLIQSRHTEEILSILARTRPGLKIL